MSLERYRKKRRFDETPEPEGEEKEESQSLRFVIQKHHASRLHYDFRLELDGVLKSWAVPKGPSLDPEEKRLAVMVEDHPFSYKDFEGVIPEGNYGAGPVIIWDEGIYRLPETYGKKEMEQKMRDGLSKGMLKFILDGKKIKGEFALFRFKGGKDEEWLLIKKEDDFSSKENVESEDYSVRSGKTLEELSGSGMGSELESDLENAPRVPMPKKLTPMKSVLTREIFNKRDWIFEIKWDGYRAIAEVSETGVDIYSRNLMHLNEKYPPLVEALKKVGHEAILDGEIVVLDEKGKSRFELLQQYEKNRHGPLVYYVFDLLYFEGRDLRQLPLITRKKILKEIIPQNENFLIRFGDHIESEGKNFFRQASLQGVEGIMAKDGQSPYLAGRRSSFWLKIKTEMRQEAVVAGFTEPRGGRKHLGALILGVYDKGELKYIGHAGGGFDEEMLEEMKSRLLPFTKAVSPFINPPKTNAPARWVEPRLVVEVAFREWTESGVMRQPVFVGIREDKEPRQVRREKPVEEIEENSDEKKIGKKYDLKREIEGKEIFLTNLKKIYWPDSGLSKKDLIAYYEKIAPVILPYLKDRPENLNRFPNGIYGESFYQKQTRDFAPDWAQTVEIQSEDEGRIIEYMICQDLPALLFLANAGCIELNPWNSRVQNLNKPDYMVLDLDPVETEFANVVRSALEVKKFLDELEIQSFCKTSGATGLHIFVPLEAKFSNDEVRIFAEILARMVHEKIPDITSVERNPAKRKGKVYLDFLQNRLGQTLASVYSVRPLPGAPVSTPLKWEEVNSSLDPAKFNLNNVFARLAKIGDLWKPVLGKGIDLRGKLEILDEIYQVGSKS